MLALLPGYVCRASRSDYRDAAVGFNQKLGMFRLSAYTPSLYSFLSPPFSFLGICPLKPATGSTNVYLLPKGLGFGCILRRKIGLKEVNSSKTT